MKTWIAALALCALLGAPAWAQAPKAGPADEDTVVEELMVTALSPGPAWWKVKKGEAVVYIMGGPMAVLPKDLKWDEITLDRRLDHAKALILPSNPSFGLGDIFGLFRLSRQLRADEALEDTLPEPYRGRFAKARNDLGKPASRYAKWTPFVAGTVLFRDYANKYDLAGENSVDGAVRRWARRHRVDTERETYKGMPLLKSVVTELSDEDKALACLGGYLENVETDPARFRAAAKAWATGDVKGALDVPRGAAVCQALSIDNFVKNSINDQVEAIANSLETPGKAVAVIPMRQLVIKDGVIEQLRARGFQVTDPASLREED